MSEQQTPQAIEVLKTNIPPKELAIQYLQHEFRKLFPGQPADFYQALDRNINIFPQQLGEKDFWQLVCGISEGYKLKWVYRTLTNSQYTWCLEKIKLDDITMTGMGSELDAILQAADWKPSKFASIWVTYPQHGNLEEKGLKSYPERDHFPIMLREKDHQLKVFDGMRRTCVAALQNKPEVIAWVGRITNPTGQMMVSADRVLFLRVAYDESPNKDPKLLEAIKEIMKSYIKNYRNGREVVKPTLLKWQQDPNLANIVNEILNSK